MKSEREKEYMRKWRIEHREEQREKGRARYNANKEIYLAKAKEWKRANKERLNAYSVKWYYDNRQRAIKTSNDWYYATKANNRSKNNKRRIDRRSKDPQYKMVTTLRARVACLLNRGVMSKTGKGNKRTIELLGCSIEFFMNHIESKFTSAMNWQNHGTKGWHIDHIKPCCSFDLTDPEHVKTCFHYTNMQPLWWTDNLDKRWLDNKPVYTI